MALWARSAVRVRLKVSEQLNSTPKTFEPEIAGVSEKTARTHVSAVPPWFKKWALS